LQGYGMTEGGISSANRPDDKHFNSIGVPFEGVEFKVAEDGELLIRGKCVMRGYFNKPELTDEVLKDGWYHTGDIGYAGDDGHFYITDRKKDLFKLSNGKYVAPQQVESLLKQSALIAQPVVVGSGRKQVGALIVPDWDTLKAVLEEKKIDVHGSRQELCERPEIIKVVQMTPTLKIKRGVIDEKYTDAIDEICGS
jgi:long-chain acyl-CoA synthetase